MAYLNEDGLRTLWQQIINKIKSLINSTVKQPDWEQTDNAQLDFIKNKPEAITTTKIDEICDSSIVMASEVEF